MMKKSFLYNSYQNVDLHGAISTLPNDFQVIYFLSIEIKSHHLRWWRNHFARRYNSDQKVVEYGATSTIWFCQMIFKSYTASHIFLINTNIAYDLVYSLQAYDLELGLVARAAAQVVWIIVSKKKVAITGNLVRLRRWRSQTGLPSRLASTTWSNNRSGIR